MHRAVGTSSYSSSFHLYVLPRQGSYRGFFSLSWYVFLLFTVHGPLTYTNLSSYVSYCLINPLLVNLKLNGSDDRLRSETIHGAIQVSLDNPSVCQLHQTLRPARLLMKNLVRCPWGRDGRERVGVNGLLTEKQFLADTFLGRNNFFYSCSRVGSMKVSCQQVSSLTADRSLRIQETVERGETLHQLTRFLRHAYLPPLPSCTVDCHSKP